MASCWSLIPLKKNALPEAGDAGLASDSKLMRLCQPTPLVATAAFHPLWTSSEPDLAQPSSLPTLFEHEDRVRIVAAESLDLRADGHLFTRDLTASSTLEKKREKVSPEGPQSLSKRSKRPSTIFANKTEHLQNSSGVVASVMFRCQYRDPATQPQIFPVKPIR
jgi:hypothetical protein